MRKLITAAAALLLAASLCLTSCGNDDSSSDGGNGGSPWGNTASEAEGSEASSEEKKDSEKEDVSSTAEDVSSAAAVPADTSMEENSAADVSSAAESAAESLPDDSSKGGEPVQFSGNYVGKWELKEMVSGSTTIKGNIMGVPVGILFQFEFKDDGTVEMMQSEYGKDIKRTLLNWKETDEGVSITGDGEGSIDFKLENGLLVAQMGGSVVKIGQVSEFSTYDPDSGDDADDSTPASSLSEADVIGKWELEEMKSGGLTMKGDMMGAPVAVMFQFEFESGGKGTLSRNEFGTVEKGTIEWKVNNDVLSVNFTDETGTGETLDFSLKNNLLVSKFNDNGQNMTIKIKKVDKFTTFDFSNFNMP
ncbi:hypothetical protein SAMN02910317_00189 [Ruminococcaceae bacterium FB2012]|nr:hypothetical protein SAMN02910317_00189 [Ruminococcaceae bacterium FB2012]